MPFAFANAKDMAQKTVLKERKVRREEIPGLMIYIHLECRNKNERGLRRYEYMVIAQRNSENSGQRCPVSLALSRGILVWLERNP